MSEALLILNRTLGQFAAEIGIQERKLEKAPVGSDLARAAQHNIDQYKLRAAEVEVAIAMLGGPYDPVSGGPVDGHVSDLRIGAGGALPPAADGRGVEAQEPGL